MAQIASLLAAGRTVSFEFFPPKSATEQETLETTLRQLEPLRPSFVSVTYRGGAESRQRTFDLVSMMQATTELNPMAHLICVAHSRAELTEILEQYRTAGVSNLMALGGDPPEDPSAAPGELVHAIELVRLAREVGGFSVGWQLIRLAIRARRRWQRTVIDWRRSSRRPTLRSPSSSSPSRSTPHWCRTSPTGA